VRRVTTRTAEVLLLGWLVLSTACRADRSEDVQPVPAPIPPSVSSAEILPLDQVRKSQPGAVAQRIATTEITISYSRPVARGRELFGALVPWGVVWHPGADKATAMAISRDLHVNDHPLAAGKYSLWTIPRPETWTIIFSRAGDVFHHPYPGEAHDALRFDVTPETGPHIETLTYDFPIVDGKDAVLRLHWGTTIIRLPIRVQ
jgi:hypothetical protein